MRGALGLACALLAGCSTPAGAAWAAPGLAERAPVQDEQAPLLATTDVAYKVVAESFITASTPQENLDSPASWTTPDGQRWVITTAKKSGELVVFDGDTGARLRTVGSPGAGRGQLGRPNGITVVGEQVHGQAMVLVVERDNHRVQMFSLPEFKSVAVFGASDLNKPYGLWAHANANGIEVIISDNYMLGADQETVPPLAQLGHRFHRYQLIRTGDHWNAKLTQSFGDTSQAGAIRIAESLYADVDNDRLLLAEEDMAVGTRLREYGLTDGKYRGRDIGTGLYKAQAEGIALLACKDGSGYWIGTDQFKDRSVFQVFDRKTLRHVGAFAGKLTANTDGVWMDAHGDARFPQGVFYALHDDQSLAAFDWGEVTRTLNLTACGP